MRQVFDQRGGPHLQEPLEDHPDSRRLFLVDHQLAVFDPVAERHEAAHPHALLAGGGEFVADALADHLALELREQQQDIESSLPIEVVVLNDCVTLELIAAMIARAS